MNVMKSQIKQVFTNLDLLLSNGIWWGGYTDEGFLQRIRPNGTIIIEMYFKNGEVEGPCTEYHENGTIMSKYNYRNGKREGEARWWYDNGKLFKKYNLVNNKISGEFKTYSKGGKLSSHIIYKNGEVDQILFEK